MDALVDLSWRAYPAGAMMAAGALGFAFGVLTMIRSARIPYRDRSKPVVWISGFRMAIVALAVAGVGAAWLSQQLWVLLIALAIGGEELLETSVILFVLRWGQREEARAKHARSARARPA